MPQTPEPPVLPEDQDNFDLHLPMLTRANQERLELMGRSPPEINDEWVQSIKDSYEQIVGTVQDHLRNIRRSHGRLRRILGPHEELIRRRWSKKLPAQQKASLLKIWPRIKVEHRPDALIYRRVFSWRRELDSEPEADQDAYLYPDINLEDLTQGNNLLRYLHARGRNDPSVFVDLDVLSTSLGRNEDLIGHDGDLTPLCVDLRSTLVQGYGSVYAAESHKDRVQGFIEGRLIPIMIATQILHAQVGILEFLEKVCEGLLHDMPLDDVSLGKAPEMPTPPRSPPKDTSRAKSADSWTNFVEVCREIAYANPVYGTFRRIRSQIDARCASGEDHIFFLREDPAYFHGALLEAVEHCHDLLVAPGGQASDRITVDTILKDSEYRDAVTTQMIIEAYAETISWRGVRAQLDKVIRLEQQPGPEQYWEVERLMGLIKFIGGLLNQLRYKFVSVFVACPMMRSNFGVYPRQALGAAPSMTAKDIQRGSRLCGIKPSFICKWRSDKRFDEENLNIRWRKTTGPSHQDALLNLFADLMWEISKAIPQERAGLPPVMNGEERWSILQMYYTQEFDRFLSKDNETFKQISSTVVQTLGDIGLLIELYKHIQYNFPAQFSDLGDHSQLERMSEAHREWGAVILFPPIALEWYVEQQFIGKHELLRFDEANHPASLSYPVNKAQTQANHEIMRRAEANLDRLWEIFDAAVAREWSETPLVLREILELTPARNTLQRTGEWSDPSPKPSPKQPGNVKWSLDALKNNLPPIEPPFGGSQGQSSAGSNPSTPTTPSKLKIKTKGVARPDDPEDNGEPEDIPVQQEEEEVRFPVKSRFMRVFEVLFHQPDVKTHPGEVPWLEFVRAMQSIGFTAEKQYGSAWSFSPGEDMFGPGVLRPGIMFHEPHPHNKIPFRTARNMGHRLTRTYDFSRTTFVLDNSTN